MVCFTHNPRIWVNAVHIKALYYKMRADLSWQNLKSSIRFRHASVISTTNCWTRTRLGFSEQRFFRTTPVRSMTGPSHSARHLICGSRFIGSIGFASRTYRYSWFVIELKRMPTRLTGSLLVIYLILKHNGLPSKFEELRVSIKRSAGGWKSRCPVKVGNFFVLPITHLRNGRGEIWTHEPLQKRAINPSSLTWFDRAPRRH